MSLTDLIFPVVCFGCRRSGRYICKSCLSKVNFAKNICPICARASIDGVTHIKCVKPQSINGLFAIWEFKGVVKTSIKKLKYNFVSDLSDHIASLMAYRIQSSISALPKKCILVPIPLHRKRESWRGFNHVEKVGKSLAAKMHWGFVSDILVRTKNTKPQSLLTGDERTSNIAGAFAINAKHKSRLQTTGYNILLFDDVFTTGSTMKEAGKVLKRSKAKLVWGLSIAK